MAEELSFSIELDEQVSEAAHKASKALKELAHDLPGVAAGLIAVSVAMLAVAVAGTDMALEVTAANASLEATFDALGKGPDAGKKTLEMLEDVGRELPQSREELGKWTRAIEKMGVTDLSEVRKELLATASAQGILGEEGPAAYERISRKVHDAIDGHHKLTIAGKELTRTIGTNLTDAIANRMGLSLEKLEQQLKAGTVDAAKFGNAMEETFIAKGAKGIDAMWMRTGAITKKIHDAFGELFKDVDTGPLTDGLRTILSILDGGAPSAEVMKEGITGAFNGIIKAIGDGITEGVVFFLELELGALQLEQAFGPLVAALGPFDDAMNQLMGTVTVANDNSVTWSSTLREIRGLAESATEVIKGLTLAIDALNGRGSARINFLENYGSISPEEAAKRRVSAEPETYRVSLDKVAANDTGATTGKAVGDGLIGGMDAALPGVTAAGKKLGEAATNGVKEGAGAKSPSVKAIKIGGYVSEGLAIGMVGSPLPERAGRQISGNALGGMTARALMAPAANDGTGGISISGLTIQITAPHGVTDANQLSATGIVIALERLQLASGR